MFGWAGLRRVGNGIVEMTPAERAAREYMESALPIPRADVETAFLAGVAWMRERAAVIAKGHRCTKCSEGATGGSEPYHCGTVIGELIGESHD